MKFRTPETIDTALLEELARRLQLPLSTVRVETGKEASLLSSGKADVALVTLANNDPRLKDLQKSATLIPTGYTAGPMAIMRSDTDIKSWSQLRGRKVCVSEGGHHVGTLAARYGAIEQVHKAPTDSLLALRVGSCDAAVHDSAMLEELIKLPEWKKFSARLPTGDRSTLYFAVPAQDKGSAEFLKRVARDWASAKYLNQAMNKAVRHIAFEVYLDQDVPDCH